MTTRLRSLFTLLAFPSPSVSRKLARFLAGAASHPEQDITTLDLLGEAAEELNDAANYAGVAYALNPRPELLALLEAIRAAEAAIEACFPPTGSP